MNIAINGSLSHMSDNINHMLSKAKITRHMVKYYNINNLLDIVNKNVNIPSENSVKIGAFVRTVVFDRDYASFLSIEELNSILNIILYRIIAFIYLNVIICTFIPCILVRINILLLLSGVDQMMPQGIIRNSLGDASRHHQGVKGYYVACDDASGSNAASEVNLAKLKVSVRGSWSQSINATYI